MPGRVSSPSGTVAGRRSGADLTPASCDITWQPLDGSRPLSADQARALPAIHNVLHGHRRRPWC